MIAPTPNEVIALGVVMPLVSIALVSLRFYSKYKTYNRYTYRQTRYGADDYLILVSVLLTCGLGGVIIAGTVQKGYGYQSDAHTAEQGFKDQSATLVRTKRYTNLYNWFFPWIYGCAKLSMLFFYRSIFKGKKFDIASWTAIVICALWMIVSFLVIILQCGHHVDYLWSSAANIAAKCLSGFNIALPIAATDVFTDLLVLFLPLFWVWRLQMQLWKKLAVSMIFLFGSLTIGASIVRLIMFALVYPTHNTMANQLAYLTTVAYWGVLEAGLCIISACLPTLGPLFSKDSGTATGWGIALAFNMERVWCFVTRQDPPVHPSASSYYQSSGTNNTATSNRKSNMSKMTTPTLWKSRRNSQNSEGKENLVSSESNAQSYPLENLDRRNEFQGAKGSAFPRTRSEEMENGNVVMTRDIFVEQDRIGSAV